MQTNWEYWRWKQSVVVFLTIGGILSFANSVLAQIVPDNTLGAVKSIVQPVTPLVNKIDGGVIRGVNLFHSFQDFNIGQGQSVYFTNPTGITNIFSRVTGSNPSQILGTLGVAGSANLYFLNPNGIIFGPNAKLDISGSFVASTANSIVFPNGMRFSASHPDVPPLLTINVSAPVGLEFEGEQSGAIVNAGNLAVGQNLSLVGGTVVSSGSLSAPNGELAVVTVPGIQIDGSTPVVNLGQSGKFVNSEIQSSSISGSSQPVATNVTLAQLLANPVLTNVLTVNANGEAQLNGSNLPVVQGDIVAKNANSQTGIFNAANNLTLVGSTLQTAGDLQLLAQNTVTVRDSVAQPFVAQASGNLLVQGNQGIDISALNNPNSGLLSGGDMVLRSANTVGGDAHYFSSGSFQIEQLDGSPGNLYSPHDPIIRSSGDVSFASYTGASLDIFAGGSVNVSGNITITGVDTAANSITENVTLSDGKTVIPINGSTQPTLDIRAGTTAFGTSGTQGSITGFSPTLTTSTTESSADITIGNISNLGGVVFLTNQYYPKKSLMGGTISVGTANGTAAINTLTNSESDGGAITLDARTNITLKGDLFSQSYSPSGNAGNGGAIIFIAGGNIDMGQYAINSESNSPSGNAGNGGTINLSAGGNINTQDIESLSSSSSGNAGNGGAINLNAVGNIGSQYINSFSDSSSGNAGNGGAINLNAGGTINGQNISATSHSGSGNAGNGGAINLITGGDFIFNNGQISSDGSNGNITITSPGLITINNSKIGNSTYTSTVGNSGTININANSLNMSDGAQIDSVTNGLGQAGNINLKVLDNITLIGDPTGILHTGITASTNPGSSGNGGSINIEANSLNISTGALIIAATDSIGNSGNITIEVPNITLIGTGVLNPSTQITTRTGTNASGNGGTINILGNSLYMNNGARISATSDGSGVAGNVNVNVDNITLIGSVTLASSNTGFFASTFGTGGGTVTVNANNLTLSDGAYLHAVTEGAGSAGNINVNANNITLIGNSALAAITTENTGFFSDTYPGSTGNGGTITTNANTLSILNGAQIAVSSQGTGTGGHIKLAVNNLTLNDAIISAQTLSNTGGNINLTIQDLLLMRNGSKISTTAGSSEFGGNGGNINISALFVVGVPIENSDITANAFTGNGGNIQISTGAIFGLQYRPFLTPYSDITASSTFGVNGEVQVATPGIDPSRGLNPLPIRSVNTQTLVGCQNGGTQGSVKFFNLGRTGLPSKPDDPLTENIPITDWIDLDSPVNEVKRIATKNSQFEASLSKSSIINQPYTIIPPCYAN